MVADDLAKGGDRSLIEHTTIYTGAMMPDTNNFALVSLGQFGTRTRTFQTPLREAALIIGLGHVGLQAVAHLHHMTSAMLSRRELQANIRMLAIARRRSIRDEATVPREARLVLNLDPIDWSDVPGRYAQIGVSQWWPHSPRAREILDDPNRVRAYSRLMLFDNAALVSETLFKQVRWLNEVGSARALNLTKRIYVLASLAEAEGSGMVFDVVSRLRALCGDAPTQIMGMFALRAHPVENDPEGIGAMANVYASLREIDAFTLQPETYRSTLPVIGHTLPHGEPRPALDMIFLTDEVNTRSSIPPEDALAECVTSWIAANMQVAEGAHGPDLPEPVPRDTEGDRLLSYSTFGVSKLALPTRAAMDLAAVGLGLAVLTAIKSAHGGSSADGWATHILDLARVVVLDSQVHNEPHVSERIREWRRDVSGSGLLRSLESRLSRGDQVRLTDVALSEWRRFERESINENAYELGTATTVPDSLRVRFEAALADTMVELHQELVESPVELAYVQGYGLVWALSALEEADRKIRGTVPQIERRLDEAEAKMENTRDALFRETQELDARSGRRFAGGPKSTPELDAAANQAAMAMIELITLQARLDVWRGLHDLIDQLIGQIREVMPSVDRAGEALKNYEVTCRQAMETTVHQPPRYPAGVVLTEQWYSNGVRNLGTVRQLPPRELLGRVYAAWGGAAVAPERRLGTFLLDIRDAARRALTGTYNFADLFHFLDDYGDAPLFQQAIADLPNSATPVMVPTVDDKHPPAIPYEIVREPSRAFSAVNQPPAGVRRSYIPSPDPDEIAVMRILHGMMAEALPALRETYRRAYDRAGAEGMPLHIDRRWDSTMADLVHTSARREISLIWENLLDMLRRNPKGVTLPLKELIHAFGVALDVEDVIHPQPTAPDFRAVVYKLKPFRLKLPPPHCAVLFIYSNRPVEELSQEVFQTISPLPLEEHFAFVVNVNGRPDMEEILEPLRRVDFTILELREADVKHLIGARLPTRALSDLVLDQVSLTTVSPFFTRGPVPDHMFFGREREINEVRSKLRSHSVALIGGRRIGKTSTLQRIQRALEPEESEYIPYYLDCHGATQYKSFFWLVNRRWEVDVNQDAHPVEFEDVITVLAERHPHKNIVLLFDEVDSLLNFDRLPENQETLFRTLRSLSNEKRCQYVFSGEKWLMSSISDPYSALFNFTQAVRLQPLPPKVVHQLVADPFEMLNIWMEQSEQVINRIYQISAGHPNIVQMICQGMVEELDQDPQNASLLTLEHLDQATSRRTLQEEIVQTIWGQMSPLAKLITLIWPEGERFLSLADIERLLENVDLNSIPPERLERTARDLELYCFVRPRDHDRLELIPMAFPAILDFMTDKRRQIEMIRRQYDSDPQGAV